MSACILIIEDSAALAMTYAEYLQQAGYSADIADSAAAARRHLSARGYDVLLLDMHLPDADGITLLRTLRQDGIETPVVVITADPSIDTAVTAVRVGAQDYISKPVNAARLNLTVGNLLEQQALKKMVHEFRALERESFCDFIGASPAMQLVYKVLENAAQSRAPVFITGESGTGKELAARAIHQLGTRKDKAFEALNCAAVPGNLLESEIFGHARGAFTGAIARYIGAAERAQGGTLFLDELSEMQLDMQSKLLRFTQSGTFRALGAARETAVDVRFVSATNRDPLESVRDGHLREDLYYRLNVISVHLPPLRDRGDDVLLIAERLLKRMAAEEGRRFQHIAAETAVALRRYDWPGNVRQLQNVLRRAVVMHDADVLTPEMLNLPSLRGVLPVTAAQVESGGRTTPQTPHSAIRPLREVERECIEQALILSGGNICEAARKLGVNASTLHRKLHRWQSGVEV